MFLLAFYHLLLWRLRLTRDRSGYGIMMGATLFFLVGLSFLMFPPT